MGEEFIWCLINIDKSSLLDLVGNVEHQLFFKKCIEKYKTKIESQPNRSAKQVTIEAVIAHLRSFVKQHCYNYFPFHAIKAADDKSIFRIPFVEGRREIISIPTRQQLCLFEEFGSCIIEKSVTFPIDYKEQADIVIKKRKERYNGCSS